MSVWRNPRKTPYEHFKRNMHIIMGLFAMLLSVSRMDTALVLQNPDFELPVLGGGRG